MGASDSPQTVHQIIISNEKGRLPHAEIDRMMQKTEVRAESESSKAKVRPRHVWELFHMRNTPKGAAVGQTRGGDRKRSMLPLRVILSSKARLLVLVSQARFEERCIDYFVKPWTSWTVPAKQRSRSTRMTWHLWGLDLDPKCNPWPKSSLTARSRTSPSTWSNSGVWYYSTWRNLHNEGASHVQDLLLMN